LGDEKEKTFNIGLGDEKYSLNERLEAFSLVELSDGFVVPGKMASN
jgi:hypothetical protein